jgi:hypothetical protein
MPFTGRCSISLRGCGVPRHGELPVCFGVVGIAVVLPGGDFVDEGLFVGNAAVEALGR